MHVAWATAAKSRMHSLLNVDLRTHTHTYVPSIVIVNLSSYICGYQCCSQAPCMPVHHLTHSVGAHTMCEMCTDSQWMFILRSVVSCTGHVRPVQAVFARTLTPGVEPILTVCWCSALVCAMRHCILLVLYT